MPHSSPSQHSASATAATLTLPEESFGLPGGKQLSQQVYLFIKLLATYLKYIIDVFIEHDGKT